jgi:hypothetical protein
MEMEGNVEALTECFDKLLVSVGLFSGADAVVNVDGAEADAECVVLCRVGGVEGEQKGHGVRTTGDGDADAVARLDVGAVEGK